MVKYPAGQRPKANKIQRRTKQSVQYGSRGMSLEDKINKSNQYYLNHDVAVIHKKPTPVQVVKVNYPKRSAAKITEAYYRHASTTDYNGVYKGYYIDFEAKEVRNKTSFPLSNLPDHQIKHMENCLEQGGLVFIILSFKAHGETYLVPFKELLNYLNSTDKQSIPYDTIKDISLLINEGYAPSLDYIDAIDRYITNIESEDTHEHR
ncbi:Holliday junction resolvase RecU [Aerococcaceae bacterium DSM 111022]|nr:Holliday junction resolvase RecU [Aerococcaceae bacterium DSM 111022]